MVDISGKTSTARSALACAHVRCSDQILHMLQDDTAPKGDVFGTARIAGIQAAKRCSDLIPLCHPLPLSKVTVDIQLEKTGVYIEARCKTDGKTGVEMEALTAASTAALTIYDMCKAVDKGMIIDGLRLLQKSGGKSGDYQAPEASLD